MQPVWVLSVDLQTKTATFQSGLAGAARSARGAFTDIKSGSNDMSKAVGTNMFEARHGVMLLGEEFGVHLPRALTSFIASIGPVGAAMEAAFPFLAIAVGATLLIEHLAKIHEAGENLTNDQMKFGTSVQNAFNQLDQKILQAQIKADELRKDHLGALRGELELIDKQSMAELVKSFEEVAKAADIVFKDLKTSWYQFGAGSEGAKHALEQFQTQYDSLMAQGKSSEAAGLLSGTLKQAEQILDFQKQYSANQTTSTHTGDYAKFEDAAQGLKKMGVGISATTAGIKGETEAQQTLVDALRAQVGVEDRITQLKALEKGNARASEGNKGANDAAEAAHAAAMLAEEERKKRVEALEGTYQHEQNIIQEGERAEIDSTRAGSQERLSAIDKAIQEQRDYLAEDTGYYKGLLQERVNLVRQMAEEETKLKAEAGKESAEDTLKMGELEIAAERQKDALLNSARHSTDAEREAQESQIANEEYALKMAAFARELAALDKNGKEYLNQVKALQDKEKQLTQQHENEITAIKEKAEQESNARILTGWQRFSDQMASGLSQAIMGHQTFSKMITSLGDQVATAMLQNAIKSMLVDDMTKEKDAAKAARSAFNIGMSMGPAGIVLGPVFGAAAFAAQMAFASGGVVPGYGAGDIVPAMLEPGEGVVPKGIMEGLGNLAKSGGLESGGNRTVVHVRPTYHVQTIDGNGMQEALEKHTDQLQRHFENAVRRMNR